MLVQVHSVKQGQVTQESLTMHFTKQVANRMRPPTSALWEDACGMLCHPLHRFCHTETILLMLLSKSVRHPHSKQRRESRRAPGVLACIRNNQHTGLPWYEHPCAEGLIGWAPPASTDACSMADHPEISKDLTGREGCRWQSGH